MIRCAIYARYSSDNQREASIEDQVRVCQVRAARESWEVIQVYADYAISGASAGRPQFQQLVADARAGRFQVILAESLDRLSRDLEHVAGFHKQMNFAGVRVVTLAEGDISELHIGLKGTMSALFLKDLAQKTHRGVEGVVRSGRSGGGLSYGYRILRGLRPDGTPITGELEIDEAQAALLRRIFAAYASGQSPRSIAKALNAEGVPGPRDGQWTASLLLGSVARETGLLRNRLFVGERVWNRQQWMKDPSTGRRIARPNPRDQWVTSQVPALAIIDPDVWAATQARLVASSLNTREEAEPDDLAAPAPNRGARLAAARRPPWLLSGLVRCGLCQGPLTVMGSGGRLGCANHVERGTCENKRSVLRDRLVARVMVGLKQRLLAPELVEQFVRDYVTEVNAANRERGARQAGLQAEANKLARQLRTLLDLIKDGHGGPAMVKELNEVDRRQGIIAAEIAAAGMPEPVPALHPNLPELYRRRVEVLEAALRDPATAAAAAEALRGLIEAIEVFPGAKRGEISVVLRGDLAAFLHLGTAGGDSHTRNAEKAVSLMGNGRSGRSGEVMGTLDAGTGFEPVTFRL